MSIKEKNKWVHDYNLAIEKYEEIKTIVATLVKGISYDTTRKNCDFSAAMDEMHQNIHELESLYIDAGKLNEDDDNYAWDEISILRLKNTHEQNDRDFNSDIKDVVDGITEWLNYHGSNGYDFFQRIEDFDNLQDDIKGQLLENVGTFWDRYIKSIKSLADT